MKLSPTPTPGATLRLVVDFLAEAKHPADLHQRGKFLRKLGVDVWGEVIAGVCYTNILFDHGYFDECSHETRVAL